MFEKIKSIFQESSILSFLANFNKKLVGYFFESFTYKAFIKINQFFKTRILAGFKESFIVNSFKKVTSFLSLRDFGIFIILVLVFNTAFMIFLDKGIDIFSIAARVCFFVVGLILIFRKR